MASKEELKAIGIENKKTIPKNNRKIFKNNENLISWIVAIGIILFIVFIITTIGNSIKRDSEARKQRQLKEFESQMRQDPTTWDKEQRDRYDSFIEWDM